jgi:hypothetical protein
MHRLARILRQLGKGWWALVPLLLAVMAAGLVVSAGPHTHNRAVPSTSLERNLAPVGPDQASAPSEWGWEWQPDMDPLAGERPIHLR